MRASGTRRSVWFHAVLAAVVAIGGGSVPVGAREARPNLDVVLERLARVADLYRDAALGFSCIEDVHFNSGNKFLKYRYEYLYRHTEDGLDDLRRAPVDAETVSEPLESVTVDDTDLPTLLLRPYSWVFVFGREWQKSYRYAFEGRSTVGGVATIRVYFEPIRRNDRSVDAWVGTAEVDADSFQPLRVEAVRAEDRAKQTRYRTTYRTEFDVERNGMRFPSRIEITRPFPKLLITQTYSEYRFFRVRTEEEIRAIIFRD